MGNCCAAPTQSTELPRGIRKHDPKNKDPNILQEVDFGQFEQEEDEEM